MIVFLTGITGLVGAHTAVELLRAGHRVAALVRARPDRPAAQRARAVLEAHPECGETFSMAELHVIEGDIERPGCNVAEPNAGLLAGAVDAVVHCAGAVAFDPAAEGALQRANTAGARHVAELCVRLRCSRFIHVGTAYVDAALEGRGFRSAYERSKLDGERVVADAVGAARLAVARPSIVTGDRVHGFTPTYHGIYPFLRYGAARAAELARLTPDRGLPAGLALDGRANLVPADHVAAVLRALVERPGETGVFPVINPRPWPARELVRIAGRALGIPVAALEPRPGPAAPPPASAAEPIRLLRERYAPYFRVDLTLNTEPTDRLCAAAGIPPLVNDPAWIAALVRWGVAHDWAAL